LGSGVAAEDPVVAAEMPVTKHARARADLSGAVILCNSTGLDGRAGNAPLQAT
jgi:hypothetical protein